MSQHLPPAPPPPPAAAPEEHRFPCDQCGADLRFDPGQGGLYCNHCGSRAEVEDSPAGVQAIKELDFRAALDARLPEAEMEELRILSCPNCAAHISFDEVSHATECPFCATPVVTGTGTQRHIKPKGVVPFELDERVARTAVKDWLGGLWFAPNGLQEYARKGRKLQGIYVPYWTFDADTASHYRGQRGTAYYVTRTVMRDGKPTTQRVRKIRWRLVSGHVARFFDDVLVLASKSLPKRFTDALEPWQLSALEPYRPDFLAGFNAEGYAVELLEGFEEARVHMDRVIMRDIKFDIGGDAQRVSQVDTKISNVTFKHILLPVWLAAYKYRGKTYRFVVNGQSGKVQGERPWSVWKITFAVILGLIIAGAVGYVAAISQ